MKAKNPTILATQSRISLSIPELNLNLFPTEVVPSESPGYILANAGLFDDASSMIYELGLGKTAQVNIPIKGEKISTTVQFTAPLPKVEYEQLLNCFSGLIDSAKKNPPIDLSVKNPKN